MNCWKLTQTVRYERNEQRQGYRSGTTAGTLLPPPGMLRSKFQNSIRDFHHRDVPGRRIRPACGGYYRGTVGQQGVSCHRQ